MGLSLGRRFGAVDLLREQMPYDFAISYNQQFAEPVRIFKRRLEGGGFRGWSDHDYAYNSIPMERQISLAFNRARFLLVFIPEGFRDSGWCRAEYLHFLECEKDTKVQKVIPVTVGANAPIPQLLKRRICFDIRAPEGFERLLGHIRKSQMSPAQKLAPNLAPEEVADDLRQAIQRLEDVDTRAHLTACQTVCEWLAAIENDSESVSLKGYGNAVDLDRGLLAGHDATDSDDLRLLQFMYRELLEQLAMAQRAARPVLHVIWRQALLCLGAKNIDLRRQAEQYAAEILKLIPDLVFDTQAILAHACENRPGWAVRSAESLTVLSRRVPSFDASDAVIANAKLIDWRWPEYGGEKLLLEGVPDDDRINLARTAFERDLEHWRTSIGPRLATPTTSLENFLSAAGVSGRAIGNSVAREALESHTTAVCLLFAEWLREAFDGDWEPSRESHREGLIALIAFVFRWKLVKVAIQLVQSFRDYPDGPIRMLAYYLHFHMETLLAQDRDDNFGFAFLSIVFSRDEIPHTLTEEQARRFLAANNLLEENA